MQNIAFGYLVTMANHKLAEKADDVPEQGDYPLTVVAWDAAGDECYRTQLDWSGVSRRLDDVPSRDLADRRPSWKNMKVYDGKGEVRLERSNDDNDDSADDAVEQRGPKYANDKAPIVDGDVPNLKDGERGDGESDAQASASSTARPKANQKAEQEQEKAKK